MSVMLVIYFIFIPRCFGFDLPPARCGGDLKISDNNYVKTNVYEIGDARPTDTHYDTFGNLFYIESGENENGFYFNARLIKCNTSALPQNIPGLPDGKSYSIAVDNTAAKVYFGTNLGIYKYNYESHEATLLNSELNIDMLFIDKYGHKVVSVNNDGVQNVFLLTGQNKVPFTSLNSINEMEIDNKNNFYFIRDEILYVLKSNKTNPIMIGNITYQGKAQIAFYNSIIFIASGKLVYIHENDTGNLKYADNAPENITSIAFDKSGDITLGVKGQLLKYKQSKCVSETSHVDEFSQK